MPKHGLAPTREKPGADPSVGGTSSIPQVVLSNEVLLRSKIAQLQLEKTEQQRKIKTSSSSGAAGRQAAAAVAGEVSSSPSPAAYAARGSRGGGNRPSRKGPKITSKHQLASTDAEAGRGRPGDGRAAAKDAAASGGEGLGRGAQAGGVGVVAAQQPETEGEVMRRFEAQVALAYRRESSESSAPKEGSFKDGEGRQNQQQQWLGLTPPGMQQALRMMYREQVHTARSMNKRADVLARKTQEIEKSNEVMRAEAEASARGAVRLEQAATKLHALSVELDGRRTAMLETRKIEAAEETARREEMNASLNAVVSDISKKIKEQEEERLAQDGENSSLRSDLQALLQGYDDNKNASEKALRAHEEEGVKLAERLEVLIAAATESLEREKGVREAIGELTAAEERLRHRVSEHAARLQRQEAGLKTYLESVKRLQAEETKLLVTIARFSKEKTDLLSRAGSLVLGDGGFDNSGGGGGGGGGRTATASRSRGKMGCGLCCFRKSRALPRWNARRIACRLDAGSCRRSGK
ncbi:unnamed protein product [Pylaiella littoralis]